MIRRLALPFALPLAVLALASCGGDGNGGGDGQPASGGGQQVGTTEKPPQNPFDAAKLACSEPPVEETAKSVGLPPGANEQEIADLYGQAVETAPAAQQASSDGCLAGLRQAPSG